MTNDQRIDKLGHRHAMKSFAAVAVNELQLHMSTWMKLTMNNADLKPKSHKNMLLGSFDLKFTTCKIKLNSVEEYMHKGWYRKGKAKERCAHPG